METSAESSGRSGRLNEFRANRENAFQAALKQKFRHSDLNQAFLASLDFDDVRESSKSLQSDIATSTMEAEYNALSMAMKDLLPLRNIFETVGSALGIDNEIITTFKTTVWEDNMGALQLAQMQPGQYTPRSKHYAVKYHWFRSHLSNTSNRTTVQYIESRFQKADALTKSLSIDLFRSIRKLLCGW